MNLGWIAAVSAVITALATGVMIWAVFVAPQKAFESQWKLQQREEARKRRYAIFMTLMATRGNGLDPRHVEALNLIDVEFYEDSERDIRDAWNNYLDHLNKLAIDKTQEPDETKLKNMQAQRKKAAKTYSRNSYIRWANPWDMVSILHISRAEPTTLKATAPKRMNKARLEKV